MIRWPLAKWGIRHPALRSQILIWREVKRIAPVATMFFSALTEISLPEYLSSSAYTIPLFSAPLHMRTRIPPPGVPRWSMPAVR